jgi:hypothetical protein
MLSGFSFHTIRDDETTPGLDRAHHILDILEWLSPIGPCPPVELELERVSLGVHVSWGVFPYCRDVWDLRIFRYTTDDSTLVPVPADTTVEVSGEFVDPDAVPGVRNAYRLVTVRPDLSTVVLAEASIFVPTPLYIKAGPNPFSASVSIEYGIPVFTPVRIVVTRKMVLVR